MSGDDSEAHMCRKVADAADAWLDDPSPKNYEVLHACVTLLREYRNPTLPEPGEPPQPDELLDELAEEHPAVSVGSVIGEDSADPRAVVERLRATAARTSSE